ncbi:MAG TPA: polysaccharide biosynthesis tyrosine autokinase [Candidatus Methylacidiphilales bacterium]|nr:polysaccharide biosynthesis tyrosine autokinase [Candidatus Methylacidiphilales bacterium]
MEYGRRSDIWSKVRVQLKRYWGVFKRFWWVVLLTTSAGICISAWVVTQMPPAFQSVGSIIVGGQVQLNEATAYNEEQDDFYGTQMKLMRGDDVQRGATRRVETLHPELKPEVPTFEVTQEPKTAAFDLRVVSQSAAFAQAFLQAVMEEYIDKRKRIRQQSSDETSVGISDEMASLNKEMESNDAAILEFQKENDIGFLQEAGNSAAKYLTQLDQQLSNLQTEYNLGQMLNLDQNLDREQSQQASNSGDPSDKSDPALTTFGPIADYQKARQQVALLNAELADKSQYLKPKHPDIIDLKDQISRQENLMATLRAQSVEALKTHQETLRLQIQNLQNVINEQKAKALDLSSRLSEFEKLKSKADQTKADYEMWRAKFQSVDANRTVDQDPVTIDLPATEGQSIKPGLPKILTAGVGGGLMLGFIILFLIDQFDDRIGSLMELQNYFPEPLLGQIPQEKLALNSPLLKPGDDRQALIESFRTLRSSIIFLPVEGKRPKTIAVTSALPNEGKTTVASNLAITLAFSGAKTLFIDSDMRSGKASRIFGAQDNHGLSNILLQKVTWTDAVFMTQIEHLFIIPCGSSLHHTAEHLLGKVTDQFLINIYDHFDYVVFDTPPVIILDDTLCLAPKIDATLFVVRFNNSSARSSRRALELLDQRQANVIGLVCNGVTLSETEYAYNYNYRQYHGKYAETKAPA